LLVLAFLLDSGADVWMVATEDHHDAVVALLRVRRGASAFASFIISCSD